MDSCNIEDALFPEHSEHVVALFREYEASLGISLQFQSFEEEIKTLPGVYARPAGGLFLAWKNNIPQGCVAFRRLPSYPGVCELKRLFVRPEATGMGIGKRLLAHAMESAGCAGYEQMWLDTLTRLVSAMQLYRTFGFKPVEPYNKTDLPDICYLGAAL